MRLLLKAVPTPQPVRMERPVTQKPREVSLPVMKGGNADFGII